MPHAVKYLNALIMAAAAVAMRYGAIDERV